MKRRALMAAAVLSGLAWAQSPAWPQDGGSRADLANAFVASWPEASRLEARRRIDLYGPPDEVAYSALAWFNRAPWSRIIIHREPAGSSSDAILEQTVRYPVPVGRWRDLTAFDSGVSYDVVRRELCARSGSEEMNRLALNVADELIRGKRSVEQARNFRERIVILSLSGKSSRYLKRLLFSPKP